MVAKLGYYTHGVWFNPFAGTFVRGDDQTSGAYIKFYIDGSTAKFVALKTATFVYRIGGGTTVNLTSKAVSANQVICSFTLSSTETWAAVAAYI